MIRGKLMRVANNHQLQVRLVKTVSKRMNRHLSTSARTFADSEVTTSKPDIPHSVEARLPLTEQQKKLYPQVEQEFVDGFPVLRLMPRNRTIFDREPRSAAKPRRTSKFNHVIREQLMADDIDWTSAWPTAKTFSPSAVPLPLRQSYEKQPTGVPRGKYANTELLKISNFLHLTPKAVERHCAALRKFCTKWPEGLDKDENIKNHFPVTYVTRDYVHAATTIRDVRARIVKLKVNIEELKLNEIDQDKMIRLLAHRYNAETGEITIETSACPVRVQNKDYSDYLLTACYFESMKHEKWEEEKTECDDLSFEQTYTRL